MGKSTSKGVCVQNLRTITLFFSSFIVKVGSLTATPFSPSTCSSTACSSPSNEGADSAPLSVTFTLGRHLHLQRAICTGTVTTMVSRAVTMTLPTETRIFDVKQEVSDSRWVAVNPAAHENKDAWMSCVLPCWIMVRAVQN